ncbi:MAG: HPr family phosphocarrier protein [Peptostreptococcaceae bacterium]|jgi:phosphocarrier protein|nr:HPr family phosphocarrier protein [Peptostreptococcaceae bacterium]
MISKKFTINNKIGLHARPAALFVQVANKYQSEVIVKKDDAEVNGKSIMGIMAIGVAGGETIEIVLDGNDEQEAMNDIEELLTKKILEL